MKKLLLFCLLGIALAGFCADQTIIVPYRPDPPISINGEFQDWVTVPYSYEVNSAAQIIFAPEKWDGPQDFSGIIRFAWRPEGLFVAAEVTDEVFHQNAAGHEMFRGDHLELFIDTVMDDGKGNSQYQFGISPGNLNDRRALGAFGRINPEVYRYAPQPGGSVIDALVDSRKTQNGWNVEALIPWSALGLENVKKGQPLRIGAALGDRDSAGGGQETLMSLAEGTNRDLFKSSGLLQGVLSDSEGTPIAVAVSLPGVKIADKETLKVLSSKEFDFTLDSVPEGVIPVLHFGGLLESWKNNGYTEALKITLNGQAVDGSRLLKKQIEMPTRDGSGVIKIYNAQFGFQLPYASTFEEANLTFEEGNPYAVLACKEPRTDFDLNVAGLVKPGKNTVAFHYQRGDMEVPLHLRDIRIDFQSEAAENAGPPKLEEAKEVFFPGRNTTPVFDVKQLADGRINLSMPDGTYMLQSYFSTPDSKWVQGSNSFFDFDRKLEKRADGMVVVRDTFRNKTAENLPLMQRHELEIPGKKLEFTVNGMRRPAGVQGYFHSGNDTSFAGWGEYGVGIAPLNDAFKVHSENYLVGKTGIGICDRTLVVPAKGEYTAEWVLTPSNGNYWDYLNRMRRFHDANFTIDGNWTFLQPFPPASDLDDAFLKDFFAKRKAKFVSYGDPFMEILPDGSSVIFAKGSAMLDDSLWIQPKDGFKGFDRFVGNWRKASPGIKVMSYFQCFLDSHPKARELFGDSILRSSSGQEQVYGKDFYPIFVPTTENEFGKAQDKVLDLCFDRLGGDGIFWDEMSHSMTQYHYGKPWDGVSGDIDPETFKLKQLKSSVSLITEKWRLQAAKRILAKGPLVANGWLYCKSIRDLKFPCMTETAQSSFAARTQLYSPIILSDHLSETSFQDTYKNILKGLDYGCVFFFYRYELPMPYETITSHMFPITPMELGPGFIIGEERILTRKSGLFGWGDDSESDVFIYDDKGKETKELTAEEKIIDGKRFREVRLYPGYSAAIVRKK